MKIQRMLAVLALCAGFSGGALAQPDVVMDDDTIFLAVERALLRTRSLAGADINVRSEDGFVTLSGVARTMEDIAAAGKIALRVRGVTGVRNKLHVADRPSRA